MKHLKTLIISSMFAVTVAPAVWAGNLLLTKDDGGNTIHTTNFKTSATVKASVVAQFGQRQSGGCNYTKTLDIGAITSIKNGDTGTVEGDQLKQIAGGGFTCMKFDFSYSKGVEEDVFQLTWDGTNYTGSTPETSTVTFK